MAGYVHKTVYDHTLSGKMKWWEKGLATRLHMPRLRK